VKVFDLLALTIALEASVESQLALRAGSSVVVA
jgi:hypothetical protein